MVALLVGYRAMLVAPVALFFAALNVGSIRLPMVLKLDSTLAGIIQGTLVLFVLLAQGIRARWARNDGGRP
jgi:simple sugar transport system permease protein